MKYRFSIVLIFLLFPVICFSEGKVKIKVKEKSEILGLYIYIKDIAKVTGKDSLLVKRIENTVLATSPKPGFDRQLKINFIKSRLKQNQISEKNYVLSCPNVVKVSVKYVKIKSKEIKKCINDYLNGIISDDCMKVIEIVRVPENVKAPAYKVNLKVIPKKYGNFRGTLNIKVGIYNENQLYSKLNIPVRVRIFEDVVVAKNDIKRDDIIMVDDLEKRKIETTPYGDRFFKNFKEVVGKRSKVTLNNGSLIKRNMIEEPPVINRGDIVTIESISGNIKITASGEAKEDGWMGKVIRVYCKQSKKDVLAEVIDKGTVVLK